MRACVAWLQVHGVKVEWDAPMLDDTQHTSLSGEELLEGGPLSSVSMNKPKLQPPDMWAWENLALYSHYAAGACVRACVCVWCCVYVCVCFI
jgi:hypothetical protein